MKRLITLLSLMIIAQLTFGQLSGTFNIPGDYATITAAVTALNGAGVGSGGVTFNVAAGYTETIASPISITATGTSSDQIIFQKSGGGANPLITAYVGTATPSSAVQDGIWNLVGSDYVTIDGIDLYDPNTTNPASMEYGYAMFKVDGTNGCQYNTIKNCVVTLNRVNNASGSGPSVEGSKAINVVNANVSTQTTAITPSTSGGTNSYNKFYTNTLQNCNYGIVLSGYAAATPFTLGDTGNDIGGVAGGTGNSILNFGGAASATNPSAGIRANNQWGVNISYNTINNNNGSGVNHVSTLRGIYAQAGTSANATISYNNVTVQSGATTSLLEGIDNGIGSTAASNTIEIHHNTVQNCTYSTATSGAYNGIYNNATATNVNIYSNTIYNNSIAGTGALTGIDGGGTGGTNINIYNNSINGNSKSGASGNFYCTRATTGNISCYGNDIFNNSFTTSSGTSSCILYGYYNFGSPVLENLYNNNIYNLSVAGSNTGSSSVLAAIYSNTTSSATKSIYGNSISNLSAISGTVHGITQSLGTNVGIYKNNIYNLSNTSSTGVVYGITITSGTVYTYNNFISDLRTPTASATDPIRGINITSSTSSSTIGVYYNTIYLNATSSGTNFGTTGIFHTTSSTSTTAALDLRNNVIVNVSTPNGTGYTVAYRRSSSTLTNYSSNSNNNDFYAGTPGANNLIFYDGTNSDQTIGAFKTRVSPRDAVSFSENPPFVNVGSTPYDLHMQTSIATQCESGGIPITSPISITTDYDGNTRNGSTPDVGADEFNGIGIDLSAPIISLTPLPNTTLTGDRTLTTSITDATGVPTSGTGLPMLYWKINAGSYTGVQASYISGSTYTFTFGAGATTGDVVSYYIVAQDAVTPTPNVGSSPSGGASGFSYDPPAASTPPTTPYSYSIVGALSGTYTVGSGGTYASLTGAAGLFADINAKVVTGNITVNILSDLTEDGTNALNQWPEEPSASNFTLTIQPNDASVKTASGTYAGGLIRLNGADRVTFDGRYGGSGNYLAFTNSNTSGAVFQLISLGSGAGATYNNIRNCNISMGGNASGTYGISIGSSPGSAGSDNDYNSIISNNISRAYYGIWVGGTSGFQDNNLTISQNSIGHSTNTIGFCGLYLTYVDNSSITQNTIFGITQTSSFDAVVLTTGVTNSNFSRNKLYGITNNGTNRASAIAVSSGTSSNLTFDNNIIYGVINNGTSGNTFGCYGFYITAGGGYNLYYNSIYMSGDRDAVASTKPTSISAAVYISTGTSLIVKDNIFMNTQTATTSAPKSYAIYSGVANTAYSDINYNDYFVSGSQGVLGYLGADQTTLAAWQTATGKDANSLNVNPMFASTTDLHIDLVSPMLTAGTPIGSVTYDYDNMARSVSAPSIGAYENGADLSGPAISYTTLGNTSSSANRSFTNVSITDGSGVNTTPGTLPRVYYKRSTDGNVWNDNTNGTDGWKWVEANGTSSPFDFTIDYSLLNGGSGVSVGNTVQYFVVAQDLMGTPNVSINSGTFAAQPASVALTSSAFPISGTINSYLIATAFSGTYNVGSSETYTSLTADAPTGIFKTLNSGVLTGNVTLLITTDLTVETGAIALNQLSEEGAGNYTLTIAPASGSLKTISGNYAGGLIRLNGADRITFDGRFAGSGNFLTFTNTATSGSVAAMQVISLGNGNGANNNTIRNCNINTGSLSSTTSYGISIGGSSVGTAGSDNDNLTIQSCNIGKAYTGIYCAGNSGFETNGLNITGNTIGSATLTESVGNIAVTLSYSQGSFSQNEVLNAQTGNNPKGVVIGTGVTNMNFSRNKIHGIKYTGTGGYGGKAFDINTGNSSSNVVFDNNLIYEISGDGWSDFTSDAIVGFRIQGTTGGLKFYYNSVFLSGNISRSSATADKSACIYVGSSSTNLDIRDNIFENTLDNTTGVATAFAIYSAAANTAFTLINYNDYYAAGAEGILGYLSSNQTTLPAWQTASGQDANSTIANPIFASTSDLHIDLSSPMLAAGTPIGSVTYDYDNMARSVSNPSIGAYENGADVGGPAISYTLLGNTTSTANRAFSNVTITDFSGVNTTSGTRPRVYYKRSTDGNVWNDNTNGTDGWKWVEANGTSSPFDFTIDYSLLNGGTGVSSGNIVQYFVVAQDLFTTPNVSINSGAFAVQPTSVALTSAAFPIGGTINSYIISVTLSGTKTVGALGLYTNLTGPSGIFKAINENVLNGDLIILINGNLTEEGTYALNQWAEEGPGGYSVTIKPNTSVTATVSGSYASGALIRFKGASKVMVDGSNNGTTSRDLTFSNTSTTSPSVILLGSIGTAPISNLTVKNCIIINGSTSSSALVVSDATTLGTDGYFNNVTIQNNSIQLAYIGAYLRAATGQGSNVTVSNNTLNTSGTNNIKYVGLYFQGIHDATVSGNMIGNLEKSGAENDRGIFIASGCYNFNVFDNSIDNLGYSGSSGYGAQGILISTGITGANINIYNNLISNITGDGDDYTNATYNGLQYNPMGIYIIAGQTGVNIYYNSIYLSGSTLNYDANSMSIGICVESTTTADIRNNIIENTLGLLSATGYGACGIYLQGSASQLTNLNNNDYFINPTTGIKAIGKISTTTTATTLGAWQSATLMDAKSINSDPLFVSTTNLQLQGTSPAIGRAQPMIAVTTDYTGATRHLFKPTIGAYEYAPSNFFMWTGLVDNDWNTPGNWSPAGPPSQNDDAGVPADPASNPDVFPLIGNGIIGDCDELYLGPGATINVLPGGSLNVKNTNP